MYIPIDITKLDPLIVVFLSAVALMMLDWLLGIAQAIKLHVFVLAKLPDQLANIALPYIGPVLVAAIMSPNDWHNAESLLASSVVLKLGIEIREKVLVLVAPALAPAPAPADRKAA